MTWDMPMGPYIMPQGPQALAQTLTPKLAHGPGQGDFGDVLWPNGPVPEFHIRRASLPGSDSGSLRCGTPWDRSPVPGHFC